jgi:hypothetical protein
MQATVVLLFFYSELSKYLRLALSWVITHRVVISYRRFETSVRNYHYPLRDNSQERSSQLLHGVSLKKRKVNI